MRFPDSVIPGSMLVCSSPRLIAAYHDLLRLLAPRHPPYALLQLDHILQSYPNLIPGYPSYDMPYVCETLSFVSLPRRSFPEFPLPTEAYGFGGTQRYVHNFKEQKSMRLGPERDRTADLLLAKQALSQLSYGPVICPLGPTSIQKNMGPGGFEPPTPRLSSVCSTPELRARIAFAQITAILRANGHPMCLPSAQRPSDGALRGRLFQSRERLEIKEVIQPHVPVRLPCYDFTPITDHNLGPTSWDFCCNWLSWCDGRCVQGPGTYSPQPADLRLLAIPPSCGRIAAHNPNWGVL